MIIKSLQKIEQGQPKLLVLAVSESGIETCEGPGAACARSVKHFQSVESNLLVPYKR